MILKKEEIFNQVFLAQGGRCNIDNNDFLKELKKNMDDKIQQVRSDFPNLPEIYFGFILNDALNACVTKREDMYFIGFNVGTVYLLQDMFWKILASRETLPLIGNVDSESSESTNLNVYRDQRGMIIFLFDSNNISSPNDPVRQIAGNLFCSIALDYLLFHECAHILHGHVDFKRKNSGFEIFSEMVNSKDDKQFSSATSQTLEMDADSFATNRTLINLDRLIKTHSSLQSDIRSFFNNWNTCLGNFSFIIYCVFRLFDFIEYPIEEAKKMSHPPASIRMALIASNMVSIFKAFDWADSTNGISKIVIDSTLAAENAFLKVTFQNNNWNSFRNSYNKESTEYIFNITDNWNNIRPLLEPLAYKELPALKIIQS